MFGQEKQAWEAHGAGWAPARGGYIDLGRLLGCTEKIANMVCWRITHSMGAYTIYRSFSSPSTSDYWRDLEGTNLGMFLTTHSSKYPEILVMGLLLGLPHESARPHCLCSVSKIGREFMITNFWISLSSSIGVLVIFDPWPHGTTHMRS